MRLTQKFIKDVADSINLNSNSYNPTEFFKKFEGTRFKADLSIRNFNLLEIGAEVDVESFIFLVPNLGWATCYIKK